MTALSVEVEAAHVTASSTVERRYVAPTRAAERVLAHVLAEVVGVGHVSINGKFFEDLGADALIMAQICVRVRKRADLPLVSMKDIYQPPTLNSLTIAPEPMHPVNAAPDESPPFAWTTAPVSSLQYVRCGTQRCLNFLGYSYLTALVFSWTASWIAEPSNLLDIYLRATLFEGALLLGVCIFPVLAKWILIGRWKPQRIRVWSLHYVRYWTVKTLVRANPMAHFAGSPLYSFYRKAPGARIGPGVAVVSKHVPACTDLLTVGAGTVIQKDTFHLCYRPHEDFNETGALTLGRNGFVGEKSVLDINTSMGDGAQLGHTSALHSNLAVPVGERWHGSPAQHTRVAYLRVGSADCGTVRSVGCCLSVLLEQFFVFIPLIEGGVYLLLAQMPSLDVLLDPSSNAITSLQSHVDALASSAVMFSTIVLIGLLLVLVVRRASNFFKVYKLYGFHYGVQQSITRVINIKFCTRLFTNSSYNVQYLRGLGYDLGSPIVETGSNFGEEVTHDSPRLSSVGSGTMVADGLAIIKTEFSSTSFRSSRVSSGALNFLCKNIVYPAKGKAGDNCLLATRLLVPLDGKVREGVGLLGSPSFEILRWVERDSRFDGLPTGDQLRRSLARKNRYNLRTMGVYVLIRRRHVFLLTLLGWTHSSLPVCSRRECRW